MLSGVMIIMIPYIAFKKKAFTLSASYATVILLAFIFLAGINYLVLIVTTFIMLTVSAKAVQRVTKKEILDDLSKKTGTRDLIQLGANGGPAMICVLLFLCSGNQIFLYGYIAAIAEAYGDSMASLIGPRSRGRTINLATLKDIPPGLSGGVSLRGSVSCVFSCLFVTLIAFSLGLQTWRLLLVTFFSSISGCFLDSLMGATVQVKYRCNDCGKITEKETHCNKKTLVFSGVVHIDNDTVNIASNIFSAVFSIVLIIIIRALSIKIFLNYFVLFVLMMALTSFLHEVGHLIGCAIWKCKVLFVEFGCIKYSVIDKRLILKFKGESKCAFSTSNRRTARLVYLSGPAMNGLLAIVAAVSMLVSPSILGGLFLLSNTIKFALNIYPSHNTDGNMAFIVLKGV